jgi:hypothetical protein
VIAIPGQIIFSAHHADLVYDDETHIYRLKSGEVLSSVTGILKAEGIQTYGPPTLPPTSPCRSAHGSTWRVRARAGAWIET